MKLNNQLFNLKNVFNGLIIIKWLSELNIDKQKLPKHILEKNIHYKTNLPNYNNRSGIDLWDSRSLIYMPKEV